MTKAKTSVGGDVLEKQSDSIDDKKGDSSYYFFTSFDYHKLLSKFGPGILLCLINTCKIHSKEDKFVVLSIGL